jgi:hypothetical protein
MARAGSRRWYNYEGDDGTLYAVEADNSNSEATIGGNRLMPTLTPTAVLFPGRAKQRYANTVSIANPGIRKVFKFGSRAAFNAIVPGSTIVEGGDTWAITSKRGERFVIPVTADTGQTGINP